MDVPSFEYKRLKDFNIKIQKLSTKKIEPGQTERYLNKIKAKC
jgi:hypothetical protein